MRYSVLQYALVACGWSVPVTIWSTIPSVIGLWTKESDFGRYKTTNAHLVTVPQHMSLGVILSAGMHDMCKIGKTAEETMKRGTSTIIPLCGTGTVKYHGGYWGS